MELENTGTAKKGSVARLVWPLDVTYCTDSKDLAQVHQLSVDVVDGSIVKTVSTEQQARCRVVRAVVTTAQ